MRTFALALAGALAIGVAAAQAQPAATNATTPPAGAAAGPGMGMGHGMGQGMGRGMGQGMGPSGAHMGGRAGPGYTMGWSLMTPQERSEHRTKMMSFTSAKECRAYVQEHHALMTARAKARGVTAPVTPPHDPCAGLKD